MVPINMRSSLTEIYIPPPFAMIKSIKLIRIEATTCKALHMC